MERERLEDGRGRRRSRRLLLEVIASSFMEHSLNNFIVHFRFLSCSIFACERGITLLLRFGGVECNATESIQKEKRKKIRCLISIVIVFWVGAGKLKNKIKIKSILK